MKTTIGERLVAGCLFVSFGVSAQAQEQAEGALEEIVVTGSFIQRSSFDSSSPLDLVGQDDFLRNAAFTVRDMAQNLTYNLGSENFPDTLRSGATTGTENINLRGLGLNSTLVLMNGRRQAEAPNLTNDGVAFVDTASMMPTIAVERMEVLKDGAAALYGSDAISGVVNFITRNDFEGFELQIDHQSITTYEDWDRPSDTNAQAIIGFREDRGGMMAAVSYLDRKELPMFGKDFTFAGGLSGFGAPGTIFTSQGAGESDEAYATRREAFQATTNVPAISGGADLDCETVPHALGSPGDNGRRPMSLFSASADRCFVDFLPTQSIIDAETRLQIFASFDYLLDEEHEIEVFGEFHHAANDVERGNSPSYGFVSAPVVPINNPGLRNDAFRRGLGGQELIDDAAAQALGFDSAVEAAEANPLVGPMIANIRPFAGVPEEVYYDRGRVPNTGQIERDKSHFVGGLRGNLPGTDDRWKFQVAGTWSEHQFSGFTANDTNQPNLIAAYQGFGGRDCNPATTAPGDAAGGCYYFNPFGSAYLADPSDVGPNGLYNADVLYQDLLDPILTLTEQRVRVLEGVISGDAFELPAGSLGLAFGAQYRDQSFSSTPSGTGSNFDFSFVVGQEPFSVSRDVYAIFSEALVPVTSADSAIGALELSLALRYEDYGGGTGDTTDPKIAFLWNPIRDLSVRGSFQTSFKAPGLAQLGGSSTSLNNVQQDPFDPASARVFVPGIAIGNPNLKPEQADVYNIGFSWQPMTGFFEGLSLNLDHWSFEFSDAIRKESNVAVIEAFVAGDPAAADKITLDGLGNIAVIRSEFINTASVNTKGVDLSARYPFETDALGTIDAFYNMSLLLEYEFQEAPGAPTVDGLGKRNFQTVGAPAPEWRANAGLDWNLNNHTLNLTLRYTDAYEMRAAPSALIAGFNNRTPSADIDEFVTVDLQYSYQFQELFGTSMTTLSFGAINLFDEEPPRLDDGPGYDSKIHDPRGRVVYGRLRVAM
ncbi:MAG: TonB-dependent receptor [Pseudomonadales bacterium]|jgi:outer membrane receptor protein involved in Fe transport|nr:TonB-dependent receptor [Pseudomonadales bacterium]